jgi:hypothetical protein
MGMLQTLVCLLSVATMPVMPALAHDAQPFERIDLRGSLDVTIERGSPPEVRVLNPPPASAQTEFEISDGVLYITAPDARRVVVMVRTPSLVEVIAEGETSLRARDLRGSRLVLDSSGTGAFELAELDVQELTLAGSGAALFRVSGHAERQVIDLDGAGQVEAFQLATRSSEVRVRGVGDIVLQATEHLAVDVAGTAKVVYSGSPSVARQVRGVGIVQAIR